MSDIPMDTTPLAESSNTNTNTLGSVHARSKSLASIGSPHVPSPLRKSATTLAQQQQQPASSSSKSKKPASSSKKDSSTASTASASPRVTARRRAAAAGTISGKTATRAVQQAALRNAKQRAASPPLVPPSTSAHPSLAGVGAPAGPSFVHPSQPAPATSESQAGPSTSASASGPQPTPDVPAFDNLITPGQVIYSFPLLPPRPRYMPMVTPDHIKALDPKLDNLPIPFVKDMLALRRTILVAGLQSMEYTSDRVNTSAKEVTFRVNNLFPKEQRQLPTHVMCVVNPSINAAHILPVHALTMAAHCARLPAFPPPGPAEPDENGNITLPMITVTLPHPDAFVILVRYLYRKEFAATIDLLVQPPRGFVPPGAGSMNQAQMVEATAIAMAHCYSLGHLVERLKWLHGFWGNVVNLGVSELGLWKIMDLAWTVVLKALMKAKGEKAARSPTGAAYAAGLQIPSHPQPIPPPAAAGEAQPSQQPSSSS